MIILAVIDCTNGVSSHGQVDSVAAGSLKLMSVSVAFLGKCLVAVSATERSEASVGACVVLSATQLGEFLLTDLALHDLIQSISSGVSSKKLGEGVFDDD